MAKRKRVIAAGSKKAVIERANGIHVDVLGSELIAQARARVAWHKRNAATMAEELRALSPSLENWSQFSRRTDIARSMRGHEEHARFLEFIARNLSRSRTYRVSLQDLSHFEIMPKGSYL